MFSALELEYKPLSIPIVFIGTHFKAKKQFASSRTQQAAALINFINRRYSRDASIIVAGDFNGETDEPFYDHFYAAGFCSAYRFLMNDREPPYTTWKFKSREEKHEKEESRTIDYIFYRSKQLTPIAYLEVPTKTEIGPNGLPSANYPSDHLALQSVFLVRVWSLSSNDGWRSAHFYSIVFLYVLTWVRKIKRCTLNSFFSPIYTLWQQWQQRKRAREQREES